MNEHYQTLELTPSCSKDDIKKAFHRLAHKHHPDKGGDQKMFIKVKDAYEYLVKHHQDSGEIVDRFSRMDFDFGKYADMMAQQQQNMQEDMYWAAQQRSWNPPNPSQPNIHKTQVYANGQWHDVAEGESIYDPFNRAR